MVALLVKKLDCNAKITEIENKIPSITGLATNSALTAAEDEILNVSNLVKKQIMAQKLLKLKKKLTDDDHDKYITTSEFNNLAARFFTARLAQANLIRKTNFHDKLKSLNQKISSNNTKHLLVENELKKQKNLIQFILEEKVILKKMVNKIVWYFSRCADTLKEFWNFVLVIISIIGNLKDCLMKILKLLLHVIMASIHN